jgi:hypothetical protein
MSCYCNTERNLPVTGTQMWIWNKSVPAIQFKLLFLDYLVKSYSSTSKCGFKDENKQQLISRNTICRYLHNICQNSTANEDHVLSPGRILNTDLELGQSLHVTLQKKNRIIRSLTYRYRYYRHQYKKYTHYRYCTTGTIILKILPKVKLVLCYRYVSK